MPPVRKTKPTAVQIANDLRSALKTRKEKKLKGSVVVSGGRAALNNGLHGDNSNFTEEEIPLHHGEFIIHSHQRHAGTNNHPQYAVDLVVEDIKEIRLTSAVIPSTFYNINNANNIIELNQQGFGRTTVTLTPQHYDESQYLVELKTQLDAAGVSSGSNAIFTCTYDSQTMKVTVTSDGQVFYFDIANNTVQNHYHILGYDASNESFITSHEMTNVLQLNYTDTLLVRGKFGTETGKAATIVDNMVFNDVITSIPITEGSGGINFIDFTQSEYFKVSFDAQIFDFYFTDERGNEIDFNGGEWSLKFQYLHFTHRQ